MHRSDIEHRDARQIASLLVEALNEHCQRPQRSFIRFADHSALRMTHVQDVDALFALLHRENDAVRF